MTRAAKGIVLAIGIVVAIPIAVLCVSKHPREPGLKYLSNARSAVWTRDGKALYYESNGKSLSYSITSGRKRSLGITWIDGISPDEQYAVSGVHVKTGKNQFGPEYTTFLAVRHLRSGRESRIYKVRSLPPGSVQWLSNDLIAFTDRNEGKIKTVLIDKKGKVLRSMPGTMLKIAGVDFKGFVYSGDKGAYYYNLATGNSNSFPNEVAYAEDYQFLSSKQLVYSYGGIRSVDLKTMTVHDLKWSSPGTVMRISPLLTKYWIAHLPKGEFSQAELYLGNTPAFALKTMRQIEGK